MQDDHREQPDPGVRKWQSLLNRHGFDAGEADGRIDEDTRRATAAFQETYGLKPTGVPDLATRLKATTLKWRRWWRAVTRPHEGSFEIGPDQGPSELSQPREPDRVPDARGGVTALPAAEPSPQTAPESEA